MAKAGVHIEVQDLTLAFGSFVIQHDLNFTVQRGDIFVIMGGSGCGKSTLLKHMIGRQRQPGRLCGWGRHARFGRHGVFS